MSTLASRYSPAPMAERSTTRPEPSKRTSWLADHDLGPLDVVAALVALLLCVAYGSFFLIPGWTPRIAVLLATAPLGVAILAIQTTRRDAIAITSAVLIGLALLTGLFSGHPWSTVIGTVGTEESALILSASLGLLAIGRELSPQGRRAVGWAVVVGASLSSAIGLLQYLTQADAGLFALMGERVSGLTPSPVYFGAVAAGAFGIVVGRQSSNSRTVVLDVLLAAWFGVAISISGSRVALGAAVVVAVAALGLRRSSRALFGSLGMLGGVAVGAVITATVGTGASAVNRVAGGGVGDRREAWGYAFDAFRERPLFGWGLGEFRRVVQGRIDAQLAKVLGPAMDQSLFDAHNTIMGVAVSLGIAGLAVVVVLTVLLMRRARGGLAVGAVALALSWLLQPMGLATFPLALLLLGASMPGVPERVWAVADDAGTDDVGTADVGTAEARDSPLHTRPWLLWLLLPGIVAGLYLIVVETSIRRAADRLDAERVEDLVELLPPDPVLADIVAQGWQAEAASGDLQAQGRSLEWSERAVELQDDRSRWWIRHAIRQLTFADAEAALESVREARRLEPNSWTGVDLELILLDVLGDDAARQALMPLGCELGVPSCTDIADT